MKLRSIETTPSPNCIKLNLDEQISSKALTLQGSNSDVSDSPEVAQQLLIINGVKSVFLVSDFITLTKENSADWQPILTQSAQLLGIAEGADSELSASFTQPDRSKASSASPQETHYSGQSPGQVEVAIQVFREIPVQVRVTGEGEQARIALPERFSAALQRAIAATQADYVAERHWQPYEPRFGNPEEVAQMVADEIASTIDENELVRREAAATASGLPAIANRSSEVTSRLTQSDLLAELSNPDWQRRLKALQAIEVDSETFPAVIAALDDQRSAIRRWAAAILGAGGMPEAIEPLSHVVCSDSSVIVRRTAGDALNDLGDIRAIGPMCQALKDRSKLVRWRAARFLNEIGDQTAVAPLHHAAEHEGEFDVRMEMVAAIERIEGGGKAQMPMWMRIAHGNEQEST